jgi:hypothetical protein
MQSKPWNKAVEQVKVHRRTVQLNDKNTKKWRRKRNKEDPLVAST